MPVVAFSWHSLDTFPIETLDSPCPLYCPSPRRRRKGCQWNRGRFNHQTKAFLREVGFHPNFPHVVAQHNLESLERLFAFIARSFFPGAKGVVFKRPHTVPNVRSEHLQTQCTVKHQTNVRETLNWKNMSLCIAAIVHNYRLLSSA